MVHLQPYIQVAKYDNLPYFFINDHINKTVQTLFFISVGCNGGRCADIAGWGRKGFGDSEYLFFIFLLDS